MTGANLSEANLLDVNFDRTNLENTIWQDRDMKEIYLQLGKANFTYIVIESNGITKKTYWKDLFSSKKDFFLKRLL